MPSPDKGENRQSFLSRCMEQVNQEDDKKDWEQDRQLAYCYRLWQEGRKDEQTNEESE